jgi:hypothetical protein
MRVTCERIEDFIFNLDAEPNIAQNVVRVTVSKRPMDGENKREASRFEVVLQASAVVNIDEGQYLLELGEWCGIDYMDQEQEWKGSETADLKYDALRACCNRKGLTIRPGVIDL